MSKPMNLSFIHDVTLDVLPTVAPVRKSPVIKMPGDDVDIRVFANGRVFPSAAFAEKANLEYQERDENEKVVGNGLDVFNSKEWGVIIGKLPVELIFVAAVPKAEAKVDLWASTKYNEDGTPKATVFEQGAATFGKNTLVPMIEEIYEVNWADVEYVDMKVAEESISSDSNVYHIPKRVSAGKRKGESTYVRREGLEIHPLIIVNTEFKTKDSKQTSLFPDNLDTKDEPDSVIEDGAVGPDPSNSGDTEWEELGK